VVQPYGKDPGRESTLQSEHATVEEAFMETIWRRKEATPLRSAARES
jgi:hypothetical protein